MLKNSGILKKLLRLGLNLAQFGVAGLGRLAGLIDFPVPPNSSMRKTAKGSIRHYYMSGIRSYLPIAVSAQFQGIRLDQNVRVLDFGCGVGRQLLHFTRKYSAPAFYACDIDETSVAFIQKSYPQVQAYTNSYFPPLNYEPGFFDMVYSVSIFSHLNPEDQKKWLEELARVTRKGGCCFLTIHGYPAVARMSRHFGVRADELRQRLTREGLLYKEYATWKEDVARQNVLKIASNMVGIQNSYGMTLLSPQYVAANWSAHGFQVLGVVEGVIDDLQDLVILRRV
jgi:SAM-dependent methyltransferase